MSEQVVVEHAFAWPVDQVWDAFVTPERFSVWFGTESVPVPLETLVLDVRPGGALRAVTHFADGEVRQWTGEFRLVRRPFLLTFDLSDDPGSPQTVRVVVSIEPRHGGSRVRLVQSRPFAGSGRSDVRAGYDAFLRAMERLLDRAGRLDRAGE